MEVLSPDEISKLIWDQKYRLKSFDRIPFEQDIKDTWVRVAKSAGAYEKDRVTWEKTFYDALQDFKIIPAGRISAWAGTTRDVTLVNTFMMGIIEDDFKGIFDALKESAQTMRAGGGIGCDFSKLRPKGSEILGLVAPSSGSLPFLDLWNQMCESVMLGGVGRGAMMATLRCDHPDIIDFVCAKSIPNRLLRFNVSVLITDRFIDAVLSDDIWHLCHDGVLYKTLPARELWHQIMEMTYKYSEPGVIFIDRMNKLNNLQYCEKIVGTNSCGEMPLPEYGSSPLASINLAKLVENPFQETAHLNLSQLKSLVHTGVRLLDNVLDITRYPLNRQQSEVRAKRRIGLGITGLADALIMCKLRYGTERAMRCVSEWMEVFRNESYAASVKLAKEKGSFPAFNAEKFLNSINFRNLPKHIISDIKNHGIRNGVITAVAPTGTISMYAGNVSSGIEPVYSLTATRQITMIDGKKERMRLRDYSYMLYMEQGGDASCLPDYLVTATELNPHQHLAMQSLVQKFIDSSISKTINCPKGISFDSFQDIYIEAYKLGCKGCSTYRPSEVRGHVLS